MCYGPAVSSSVSVRELRNRVSEVLRRVEGGERVTVTIDRRPVAEARSVASRHAADRGLLAELRRQLPDTTDEL